MNNHYCKWRNNGIFQLFKATQNSDCVTCPHRSGCVQSSYICSLSYNQTGTEETDTADNLCGNTSQIGIGTLNKITERGKQKSTDTYNYVSDNSCIVTGELSFQADNSTQNNWQRNPYKNPPVSVISEFKSSSLKVQPPKIIYLLSNKYNTAF